MPAHCEIRKAPTETFKVLQMKTTGGPGRFPEELQDQRYKNVKKIAAFVTFKQIIMCSAGFK